MNKPCATCKRQIPIRADPSTKVRVFCPDHVGNADRGKGYAVWRLTKELVYSDGVFSAGKLIAFETPLEHLSLVSPDAECTLIKILYQR